MVKNCGDGLGYSASVSACAWSNITHLQRVLSVTSRPRRWSVTSLPLMKCCRGGSGDIQFLKYTNLQRWGLFQWRWQAAASTTITSPTTSLSSQLTHLCLRNTKWTSVDCRERRDQTWNQMLRFIRCRRQGSEGGSLDSCFQGRRLLDSWQTTRSGLYLNSYFTSDTWVSCGGLGVTKLIQAFLYFALFMLLIHGCHPKLWRLEPNGTNSDEIHYKNSL